MIVIFLLVFVAAFDAGRWIYLSKKDPNDSKYSIADLLTEWWFERVRKIFR